MRRVGVALGVAGGAAVLAHVAPAVMTNRQVRMRAFPAVAGVGRSGHVALTFDDGPDPASTPAFLEALDRLGYRATFFMLGEMVEKAPSLAAEVVAAGHEVGVHGFRHKSHLERTPGAVLDDVARARDVIASKTGASPTLFRPPYGAVALGTLRAARRLQLQMVLWTCWGRDWRAEATPASVIHDVTRNLASGGTILLHDSDCTSAPGAWHSALGALEPLAERCRALSVDVGPLRDHFAA